ncbi:MAG: GNAT family N-acetyltransferase [Gemmataceae bacterium]
MPEPFQTPRLTLRLQTPAEVLAWVESLPPEVRAEVSPAWIEKVRSTAPGNPWQLSYTIAERATGTVVGNCSFKGAPDATGMVEIAYGIDEPYQGQGYATEAAIALAHFAATRGEVKCVRAHTRGTQGASARVLTKAGFVPCGEVIDPEDGLVERWEWVAPPGVEFPAPVMPE